MYLKEDIINWKNHRNDDTEHKSVFVSNKQDFPMICDLLKKCTDIAYISIESTEKCAKILKFSNDNTHYLQNAKNVLNIEFDDVEEDNRFATAITEDQAKQICEFINDNTDKHFVIHCRAGQSRSQAIYSYITEVYDDIYKQMPINKINPCLTPNSKVRQMLFRYVYQNMFL